MPGLHLPPDRRRGAALLLLLSACLAASAQAQGGDDIAHRIQPGDTLYALAQHYLGDARQWPQIAHVNQVRAPRRLQPGGVLRIPAHLLALGTAEVVFASGDARIAAAGEASEPARAGQALGEGASIRAAADSFVSVRLADGTVVRVQADSQVQIEQLRRRGRAGDAQSILRLQRGSVEPTVPPRPEGARRFEIRTPGASTAVRGTQFVVTLAPDGRTLASVTHGSVAVAPGAGRSAAAPPAATIEAGQGIVVASDGRLGERQALLPAPDLAALPAVLEEADFLRLRLAPVAGAAAYQVQLARDAQLSAVVRSSTSADAQVLLPALPDGNYHLAVRAFDAHGLPGLQAQRTIAIKAHPLAPLRLSPTAGASVARDAGTLACTPVAGVARYRIQVAPADASFDTPLLDAHASTCALALPALAPGTWRWRVASVRELPGGASDQGPFGPPWSFTVAERPVAPGAVEVDATGERLRLSWPAEPGQRFQLQLASGPDFHPGQIVLDQQLAEAAWQAPAIAPGPYYVRLRTFDPSGLASDFSTPRQVTVPAPVRSGTGLPVRSSDGQPLSLR